MTAAARPLPLRIAPRRFWLWAIGLSAMSAILVIGGPFNSGILATGSTPVSFYAELVRLHREERLSFANVITFNLDEYRGLSADHPQSYHHFMRVNLFDHLDARRRFRVMANVGVLSNYFRWGSIHDVVHETYVPNDVGTPSEAALPPGVGLGPFGPGR